VARISEVSQPIDPREPKRVGDRRPSDSTSETASDSATSRSDSVNISSDARDTDALRYKLTAEAANTPDVREDKVADVKARIASGEFDANSDEVKHAVANGILNQLGI